ncbi:MAG: ATP/GTP-binding protein [Candidatus Ornithospirochaeta sp.]
MITKFTVENFKSFDSPAELNLISSSKIRVKPDHRIAVTKNIKVLKNAVIYGANASGKSNLIDAVSFFVDVVYNGLPIDPSRLYCRNKDGNENRDSVFEIQIEIEGKFYAYGFSAILKERIITGEWLYQLNLSGNGTCIFEKEMEKKPKLGKGIDLSVEEKGRFDTYSSDFENNTTSLFLSEMNRGKKLSNGFDAFNTIYKAITDGIVIITPHSKFLNFQQYHNMDSLPDITNLIKTFDTGVSDIRIKEIDENELKRMLPAQVLKSINEKLVRFRKDFPSLPAKISGRADKAFFCVEMNLSGGINAKTIKMTHGNSMCDFCFDEESDGTIRLFDLIDILLKKSDDTVFFVDELERSLHPKMTEHFLQLFNELHFKEKVQLVFTTHESMIMDQDIFRRDEIWFVERDKDNNSTLYPLDRFKERYDKKLSKAYLEGRYGAVPVFKKFAYEEE